MKRSAKHANQLLDQAERKISRLEDENRKLKTEKRRNPVFRTDLNLDALSMFLDEYGSLLEAADPVRGRSYDSTGSKAADQPHEGESTQWQRSQLAAIDTDLRRLTGRIQASLGTPPDERVTVDSDGRCVACGKQTRRTHTRTWHAEVPS